MRFSEVIEQACDLLQRQERISYRSLKREFALDEESLDDLKFELIEAKGIARDENGKVLVWTGNTTSASSPSDTPPSAQPPASYTPPHLAERILAEQAAMESRGAVDGERKTITAAMESLRCLALQSHTKTIRSGRCMLHSRMQEAMQGYSDQVRFKHGVPLHMRVGVNTGEVVVRSIRKDDLHTDYVPVGHSTNLAARMEQLATPGSIVISEYTRKLTEGYFELKALGAADIKGVEEPLNVYEVVGVGPLRTRFQVTARRGLTRFVGRRSELDHMQQALEHAKAGHGQIMGVRGEPGLGKSRLFHEFKRTSHNECLVLEAFAVSHGQASPYLPFIELLKTYFHIDLQDDNHTRRERVVGRVLALDRSLEVTLPYLFSLLGIEDQSAALQQMDPQIRRQRTFEALKQLLLRESLNQPILLVCEDLHWIDTETQGCLDVLAESLSSAKLLLLVNYRPEYRHEWEAKTYYTQLRLAPLGKEDAAELLTFLLGHAASLAALKPLILDKTEGTPFFLEEVVQTLVEEGALVGEPGQYRFTRSVTDLRIPPTVQGILAARIDRLMPDEKGLLQQLSVIGRQFPLSLAKRVVLQTEDEIHALLSALQAKEFVYEQPAFPETRCSSFFGLTKPLE